MRLKEALYHLLALVFGFPQANRLQRQAPKPGLVEEASTNRAREIKAGVSPNSRLQRRISLTTAKLVFLSDIISNVAFDENPR